MLIQEAHLNATKSHRLCDDITTPIEETILDGMTQGEMFRWFRGEYGRCTGKVYVDTEAGPPITVGWVFVKREQYEDCSDTYLHETWITLLDKDETVRTVEYHELADA